MSSENSAAADTSPARAASKKADGHRDRTAAKEEPVTSPAPRPLLRLALSIALSAAAGSALAAKVGKTAPGFTAKDIDGKVVSLNALRGKYVVLEWHNKGCPFVVKHYGSGNLPALQAKWTAKQVAWISIVSSKPGAEGYCTPDEAHADIAATKTAVTAMILDPDGKLG